MKACIGAVSVILRADAGAGSGASGSHRTRRMGPEPIGSCRACAGPLADGARRRPGGYPQSDELDIGARPHGRALYLAARGLRGGA